MNDLAPIPAEFTSVIAAREFGIIRSGVASSLVVEIGMPTHDVETIQGYDWRCPIRMIDGTMTRERHACGVDSFQALHLAMRVMHDELEQIRAAEDCHLELFGAAYIAGAF